MEKINKFIDIIKKDKNFNYFLIIVIGIIVSIPIINIQIFDTHDGPFHLLRLIGIIDTIKTGQIPSIIVPDFCRGTGYAMTLFYPPLVTYIPLIVKLITNTYAQALKLFGAICIVLSGITMYNFMYRVTKNRFIALFSAIIYMIAPYKLADVYKRYAIGEFVALIFLPTLFTGMHSLFEGDGKKHYYIALGTTLIILSHTLTTVFAAIFCAIYVAFNIKKLKNIEVIKKIIINIIFIILLTMLFYVLIIETKSSTEYTIFNDNLMRTTNYWTYEHSIRLSQFFVDIGEENGTTFIIGIPIFILFITSIYTFRKVDKNYKTIYVIFLIFSIVSLHMSTKYFPWLIVPKILCKIQFPWRMIGFFNFFVSLICGINLYIIVKQLLKKDILRIIAILIFIVISIIYTLVFLNQYTSKNLEADNKYESEIFKIGKISHLSLNRDYLPLKAVKKQHTYMNTRNDETLALEGFANIISEQKEKLNNIVEIENAKEGTILEFSYIYYPGYNIKLKEDGKEITLESIESENGYVAVILPNDVEKAQIHVYYEPTILTKLSYIVSIVSVVIFLIYIYLENRRNKC